MQRRAGRHVAALSAWSAAVGWWLWPVLANLSRVIPGSGPGDNLTFVWNLWWMRQAVQHSTYTFFSCPLIFYPAGVDLTLHTNTAFPALIAAVAAPAASLLATQNILIASNVVLNGVAAYALAFYLTRRVSAALVAAIVFGWSPYVEGHLQGHFNLIGAWPLPLVTLLALVALHGDRGRGRAGPYPASAPVSSAAKRVAFSGALGAVLGATAYMDYYYAVFGILTTAVLAIAHGVRIERRDRAPFHPALARLARVLLGLAGICAGVAVIVAVTGGGVVSAGPIRASVRGTDNPLGAAWIFFVLFIAVTVLPRITLSVDRIRMRTGVRVMTVAIAVTMAAVTPLLAGLWNLWRHSDYVTQHYLWRSAPRGIDLATLLLGNPFGMLRGGSTAAAYLRFGIEPIEQTAWLGPAVTALCLIAIARRRAYAEVRLLLCLGAVFLAWAAGPYVVLFGHSTAMILPVTALRYLPILSNARIPGRAIVIVYMVAAMLCAEGTAHLLAPGETRRRWAAALLGGLVMLDYAPAVLPHYSPGHPVGYQALADAREPGAVLELPLGLRDGFGGRFDSSVLYYQSLHGRPILGGFVARLPPSVRRTYESEPLLARVLRLSAGAPPGAEQSAPAADGADLIRLGIRYVVVDRAATPPGLAAYVRAWPLRLLSDDGSRSMYVVER
ncbi:MAG: hypothetical protein ABI818_00360 [Acidobacteriota bacterium]